MRPPRTFRSGFSRRNARLLVFFVLLTASLFLAFIRSVIRPPGPPPTGDPQANHEQRQATVARVYDGDTFRLRNGDKVRLLGIDALDSHNEERLTEQAWQLDMGTATVREWSDRATRRAKDLVEGQRVRLEFGPERADDYGRLLAYVFVEQKGREVHLNRLLIREGLATATRRFAHPLRDAFIALEKQAKKRNRGLWEDAGGR